MNRSSDQPPPPRRIVVIGGGFSGAMSAVNLARLSEEPLHITVINDEPSIGRGVAYRLRRPEYLLNVAARNMSAFPQEPDHFLQWLRTRSEFESATEVELRERFAPRQIYGDYLRSIVQHHLQSPSEITPVSSEFVIGKAVDVEPRGAGCVVHLADGSTVNADRVVLATGNEPPAPLPGAEDLVDHPAWVGNPWQKWEQRLPHYDKSVVILGTGLTAVDAILTMRAKGWLGSIHAVSRHGWFPHSHFRGIRYPDFPPPGVDVAALGLDELLLLIEEHCAILHERNANPAIIVDKLRSDTQRIWSGFSSEERLRFAKKHAARWNVFRHRIAPDIFSQITSAQLTGQLRVHADSIQKLRASGDQIVVDLADGASLEGDLVLNATGPSTKFTATQSVLLQNLLRRGEIAPDDTDMGIHVDFDHTVLTGTGDRSPWLLALGPMLRGTYWETIAVPELRVQARHVAETLLGSTHTEEQEGQLHLEYMI
ncbi:FAD/NAD(P)-binding protein [Mycobacterium sp. 2YAF39]|uniref:FAD/NAD(P)-binding protein n=1 Tax=Mycobacterium sp. 2YAF39 TaxID=3233033 RepID=UPI003F9B68B8